MFAKSCYKHNLNLRLSYKVTPAAGFARTAQTRIADLDFSPLGRGASVSQLHSRYLLINIFIIVFPFKFIQDKKEKKTETVVPAGMHDLFSLQHRLFS